MSAAEHSPTQGPGESRPRREVLAGQFAKPLRDFLDTEAGSAGLLLGAAILALLVANSPWSDSYFDFWHTELSINAGSRQLSMDLVHWVNDGLMVVFFFIIGLEMRHELAAGELRNRRRLVLPLAGALGGLIIPAILYILVNPSGDAMNGWGVVIGTDTAFLLGALALVGPKFPGQLRVLLLTMTILDDLMAVAIIGAVYSDSIDLVALAAAVLCLSGVAVLGWLGVWQTIAYAGVIALAWLATVESGLHASITGMVAGLLVVSHPPRRDALDQAARLINSFRQSPIGGARTSAKRSLQRAVSVNERLQSSLHPWTSFVIVPIFAFANAGIDLRGGVLGEALTSLVTWGVVLGLVIGKPIGIGIAALATVKFRWGALPSSVGPGNFFGGGALSGMGFSVSILIANLAFDSAELQEQATVGVLIACAFCVVTGWLSFRFSASFLGEQAAPRLMLLDRPVDPAHDHIRGPVDAPLTLVEYADFECAYCGAASHVVDELIEHFGDDLRYVFRHLPLEDVHPHAELAAAAAEAAGMQGRFWDMYDMLFLHQDQLELEDLIGYAGVLDLDVEAFTRVLTEDWADSHLDERVQDDVASAEASGARATPTFFIGNLRHVGPWDTESLIRALEAARSFDTEGASDPSRS